MAGLVGRHFDLLHDRQGLVDMLVGRQLVVLDDITAMILPSLPTT